jgi:hypothetical protein
MGAALGQAPYPQMTPSAKGRPYINKSEINVTLNEIWRREIGIQLVSRVCGYVKRKEEKRYRNIEDQESLVYC